jgi:hypothetical protein
VAILKDACRHKLKFLGQGGQEVGFERVTTFDIVYAEVIIHQMNCLKSHFYYQIRGILSFKLDILSVIDKGYDSFEYFFVHIFLLLVKDLLDIWKEVP